MANKALNYKLAALVLVPIFIHHSAKANPPLSAVKEPLRLSMQMLAPFSAKSGWQFTVSDDGKACLNVSAFPHPKTRAFQVSAAQMARLRKVVTENEFFALKTEYGDRVPDGDTRIMDIKQGSRSKLVRLHFLRENDPNLREVQRALRVWNTLRDWFHDADAADLRPYEKHILNVSEPQK